MRWSHVERGIACAEDIFEEVQTRLHGEQDKRTLLPARERRRRHDLCLTAIKVLGSPSKASKAIGVSLAQWHYWQHGSRPVPDRHVEKLEKIAKGEVE